MDTREKVELIVVGLQKLECKESGIEVILLHPHFPSGHYLLAAPASITVGLLLQLMKVIVLAESSMESVCVASFFPF